MVRWSLVLLVAGLVACGGEDPDSSTDPVNAADAAAPADGQAVAPSDSTAAQDVAEAADTPSQTPEDTQPPLADIAVPEVVAGVDGSDGEPTDVADDPDVADEPVDVASADLDGGGTPEGPPVAPDPLPAGLSGEAPPSGANTGPPNLAGVLDTTETPPTDTDLIGHWTVLWFYPAASTSG